MRASELISELAAIINHTGDAEVMIDIGEPYDPNADLEPIDVIHGEKKIWITAR